MESAVSESKPLPLIYIAGKFRGPTPYAVRLNVERARDVGLKVAEAGGYPVIPHTMTCDFDKLLTDEFWRAGTLEMMRRCDAVFMLQDWPKSAGATAERAEALDRGIEVLHGIADLQIFMREWRARDHA